GAVPESAWRHAALQPVVWGDVNPIGSAAWSPDGRTLARAGMGCVWFWDLSAGRHRATSGPTGPRLGQLAWPAGDVRACLRTGQWVAFDGVTAAMRPTVRIAPSTVPAVMSPDGSLVAVADTEQTCIHGADTAKLLRTLRTKAKFPPAWSRDGQLLATVADETTVWDVTTGEPLRTLPIVGRCEWSPDGSRLAYTIGNGALLEIRDAEQGELIATLENDEPVVIEGPRLAWSRDGKRIAGFGRIWDAGDGKLIHHLQRFGTAASSFSPLWSPDDRFVTYSTPEFSTAIADADTGEVAMTLLAFSQSRSLAVSAEGHFRASPRTDEELVYIVQTDEGQDTLSPREFDEKYEWKNDPARVGLASRPARRVPRRKPPVFQDLPPD
ncbi:MAG TPA: hypothetical protein VND64_24170, partial [Pirellulales bacterium]|nr:hypothetical protein [Pirellulales bacterium]